MKCSLVPSLSVILCLPMLAADDRPASYSQTYSIFIKGEFAGTESVNEQPGKDNSLTTSSLHEIFVSDGIETKRMAFTTQMVLASGTWAPSRYSCQYNSGDSKDSYEVIVRNGQIVRELTRNSRSSEASLPAPAGFVIVDFSVYYQYDYLVRKYDFKKGGRQTFQNFLPVIAAMIPIALTRLQDSTLSSNQKSIPVQNFKVELIGSWAGTLSCDKNGRLVRFQLQDKGLEVVRRDLQQD